jgi:Uma2 family endonuclease
MVTGVNPPEQRIVLENITWDVYERLLAAHQDRSVPRFTYDQGRLEIMSPSAEHEELKHLVALCVEVMAEEMLLNIQERLSCMCQPWSLPKYFTCPKSRKSTFL